MILKWGNPPASVLNAPVYLARAKGMLTLPEVEIVPIDTASGNAHTRALLNGEFDMGHIGAPPLMSALSRTREYALVGTGLLRHPPHSMLVPAEVNQLSEIVNQPIGINRRGTCSHSILRTLLARERINESHLQLVEMGSGAEGLSLIRRGELSGAVLWEPFTTTALREMGWKIFSAGRAIWFPPRYCTMIYARRSLAERSPELVRRVLRAYASWVQAAQLDLDSAAEHVVERMPGIPPEDIRSAIAREAPTWRSDTNLDLGLISRAIAELEVQAVLTENFSLDDAIIRLGV